jgi:hypothetical protein
LIGRDEEGGSKEPPSFFWPAVGPGQGLGQRADCPVRKVCDLLVHCGLPATMLGPNKRAKISTC